MAIACPNCDHRLNLKAAKPGRYRPRCPGCDRAFLLVIPVKPGAAFEAHAFPSPDDLLKRNSSPSLAQTPTPRTLVAQPQAVAVGASSHLFGMERTAPDLRSPSPAGRVSHEATNDSQATERVETDDDYAPPPVEVRGFRIERELGRGGMGAVYLARQLSLDRPVALKVMGKQWAADPTFVARFTREAYAAAQLSHPNIVQIHDIGEVEGTRFFSMEFVRGRSLADVVKADGKLDPETAVGYVLQAARGLKHAHDRGMIHRDVKPDNLLLDDQGLVKVADLGLVKTPSTTAADDALAGPPSGLGSLPVNMTGARMALGTPAYMSPEQCRDAATVDQRADVYSLGCTLYVLVTGRPPFDGTTAVELMTKHAYEPMVPPERIVARLPPEVAAVIKRMMAKTADERFPSMNEVIRTLEAWLGVRHAGGFAPQEAQIAKLEGYVHAFNAAPAAVTRGRLVAGFFAAVSLVAVLLLFFGRYAWAAGLLGMAAQAVVAYFVIDGVARKGHLFTRVKRFVCGLGWADWGILAGGLGLFALLLAMGGVFWMWAGFGLLGVGLAFGLRYGLDVRADAQRRAPLRACEKLLRQLRMRGLGEDDVRQFVAKFAGRHWEEFYETLFGYEAKLAARTALSHGGTSGPRERFAAWREPLLSAIERIETARREARERRLLQAVEQARLEAAGHARAEAERRAKTQAEAMVRHADLVRQQRTLPVGVGAIAAGVPNPEFVFASPKPDRIGWVIGLFVGPHVRTVLAAVLLAGCGVWAYQNGLIPGAEARAAVEATGLSGLRQAAVLDAGRATRPLVVEDVPAAWTAWVDSFNVGAAGLLLLASLFARGNLTAVFVLLGAGVAVFGHQFSIRTVEPVRDTHVALMLGTVLALVGFRCRT